MTGRHLRFFTAAAAVLVVCGLMAGAVAAGTAAGGSMAGGSMAGGSTPSSFRPGDLTATSVNDWWVLGAVRCGRAQCLAIRSTRDGGRSFTAVPTPPSSATQPTVSELHFANARDGYAFGPQLWSTHDGGRTWRHLSVGFTDTVATAGGYVYAVITEDGSTELKRSPVGSDHWRTLRAPGLVSSFTVMARGSTVIVQVHNHAVLSADRGAHFRRGGRLPTGTNCQFDSNAEGPVLWALCFRAAADPGGVLVRSVDGGATWVPVSFGSVPTGGVQAFAAASGRVAVIAGYQRLYRTTDAGASWSPVAGLPPRFFATYLGFIDGSHGVAIGGIGGGTRIALYSTSDSGANYHRVALR